MQVDAFVRSFANAFKIERPNCWRVWIKGVGVIWVGGEVTQWLLPPHMIGNERRLDGDGCWLMFLYILLVCMPMNLSSCLWKRNCFSCGTNPPCGHMTHRRRSMLNCCISPTVSPVEMIDFVILSLLSRRANFNHLALCRCASAMAGYAWCIHAWPQSHRIEKNSVQISQIKWIIKLFKSPQYSIKNYERLLFSKM